ncbi:MAG: potassium channel family protein [Phycisphaerales bacterium]|nr:potassium channel family protein [Phycisphaerales bacterium]
MDKVLSHPEATSYRLFMLFISVISLLVIGAMMMVPMEEETFRLLGWVDVLACMVFFLDFGRQLSNADSKLKYFFTWGWIDLLASIPSVDAFRWGRAVRLVRIIQVLRCIRSIRHLIRILEHYRQRSVLLVTMLMVFLSITLGSMGILHFELGVEDSNIRSAEDAIWWAWVTITTVGYGDFTPVTNGGRGVAAVLMLVGVGIVSSMSGLIASWLLRKPDTDE